MKARSWQVIIFNDVHYASGIDAGGFFENFDIFVMINDNSGLWYEMPNAVMPAPREYTSFNVFQGTGVLFGLLNVRVIAEQKRRCDMYMM